MLTIARSACAILLLGMAAATAADFPAAEMYLAQALGPGRIYPSALAVLACGAAAVGAALAWLPRGASGRSTSVAAMVVVAAFTLFGGAAYVGSLGCECVAMPAGWGSVALVIRGMVGLSLAGVLFLASAASPRRVGIEPRNRP
jgi:hypothetical protein